MGADFNFSTFIGAPLEEAKLPKASDFAQYGIHPSEATTNGNEDDLWKKGPAERLEELYKEAAALQARSWPPSKVLACAKHLCGGATDATLRTLQGQRNGARVSVCVATCCHHRCDAGSYVNLNFLTDLGVC